MVRNEHAPKLEDAIKADFQQMPKPYEDCTACKLTGVAAFSGLGFYSAYVGYWDIFRQRAHIVRTQGIAPYYTRLGLMWATAGLLCGAAVYRLDLLESSSLASSSRPKPPTSRP